jgi:hypothetical protein
VFIGGSSDTDKSVRFTLLEPAPIEPASAAKKSKPSKSKPATKNR